MAPSGLTLAAPPQGPQVRPAVRDRAQGAGADARGTLAGWHNAVMEEGSEWPRADTPLPRPRRARRALRWALIPIRIPIWTLTGILTVIVAVLVLIFGYLLLPQAALPPPITLALSVTPTTSITASTAAACVTLGAEDRYPMDISVGRSSVQVSIAASAEVSGLSVAITAAPEYLSVSDYNACASTLPRPGGTSGTGPMVTLPTNAATAGATVGVPELARNGTFRLEVLPPPAVLSPHQSITVGPWHVPEAATTAPVAYAWYMTVIAWGRGRPLEERQSANFTILVPPS